MSTAISFFGTQGPYGGLSKVKTVIMYRALEAKYAQHPDLSGSQPL